MGVETEYMSLEDVADMLGVTYQLIYRLVRSGELPAVRLGKLYRVSRSDLDGYLERSKSASSAGGVVGGAETTTATLGDVAPNHSTPDCRMRHWKS